MRKWRKEEPGVGGCMWYRSFIEKGPSNLDRWPKPFQIQNSYYLILICLGFVITYLVTTVNFEQGCSTHRYFAFEEHQRVGLSCTHGLVKSRAKRKARKQQITWYFVKDMRCDKGYGVEICKSVYKNQG